MTLQQQQRAQRRLCQVNSLICNIGLQCTMMVDPFTHKPVWMLSYPEFDIDGFGADGMVDYYNHERSMMRRVWKLYRQSTGD